MTKLTEHQKRKLRKLYPNGEAIGRAIFQQYLNIETRRRYPETKIKEPSQEELEFLSETVTTNEQIANYDKYIRLREAMFALKNVNDDCEDKFAIGYYKVLYCIHPVMMGLKVFNINPLLLNDNDYEDYKGTCNMFLHLAEEKLDISWGIIRNAMSVLYVIELVFQTIAERFKFDLNILKADFEDHIDDIHNLQFELKTFYEGIQLYKENAVEGLNFSDSLLETITRLSQENYNDWKVEKNAAEEIVNLMKEIDINIPNMNYFIRSVTGRL